MAIEIRELLIKATVTKSLNRNEGYMSWKDFQKEKRKILEECTERIREELEDFRSGR